MDRTCQKVELSVLPYMRRTNLQVVATQDKNAFNERFTRELNTYYLQRLPKVVVYCEAWRMIRLKKFLLLSRETDKAPLRSKQMVDIESDTCLVLRLYTGVPTEPGNKGVACVINACSRLLNLPIKEKAPR